MSTTTDLIESYVPVATSYIRLGQIGADLDSYAVTLGLDNDTLTVWTWEGFEYRHTTMDPAIDRTFSLAQLDEVVSWLNRQESHALEDGEMAGREVEAVGNFGWSEGDDDKETGLIRLDLTCGDERYFKLGHLLTFVRAARRLDSFDAEQQTPTFNR
jgi:hypothetical protein